MIQDVFRAEGLPLDLAYVPVIESGFKTNALSGRARAALAVHESHGDRKGAPAGLVLRRASESPEVDSRPPRYLKTLVQDVRRRLASRARGVQRRAWAASSAP